MRKASEHPSAAIMVTALLEVNVPIVEGIAVGRAFAIDALRSKGYRLLK